MIAYQTTDNGRGSNSKPIEKLYGNEIVGREGQLKKRIILTIERTREKNTRDQNT